MIWILLLLCLGIGALVGFYQGPIRGMFTLAGLTLACLLAEPLSPLFKPLMTLFGVKNPLWLHVLPPIFAFIAIIVIFSIAGAVVHRKITVKFKYTDENDIQFYRWERFQKRVGICTGLFVGGFYFLILLLPVYIGGYFTLELAAKAETVPTSVKVINTLRTQMQDTKMDHVLASYDPTPDAVYQASDTLALVLENPELEPRLARYPVFLALAERPEFNALATDPEFRKFFETRKTAQEILDYPKVQAIITNQTVTADLAQTLTNNLPDLNEYLKTGKSKYDSEKILGVWVSDPLASYLEERKKLSNQTAGQIINFRSSFIPKVTSLMLVMTTDKTAVLKKENPSNPDNPTIISKGTWETPLSGADTAGEKIYTINLPGNNPESMKVTLRGDANTILLSKDGAALVMSRE